VLPLPVAMQRRGIGGGKKALLPVGIIFRALVGLRSCTIKEGLISANLGERRAH
jgi:hypothetical protein